MSSLERQENAFLGFSDLVAEPSPPSFGDVPNVSRVSDITQPGEGVGLFVDQCPPVGCDMLKQIDPCPVNRSRLNIAVGVPVRSAQDVKHPAAPTISPGGGVF